MRNKKFGACLIAAAAGIFFAFGQLALAMAPAMQNINEIEGGESFGSAVLIGANSYRVASLPEDASKFFYYTAKPGQEISISARFAKATDGNSDTSVGIKLYDSDQQELRNEFGWTGDTVKFAWLPDLGVAGKKYYVEVYNDGVYNANSFTITVSTADYYDANTLTDAGPNANGAINVKSGQYKGYLSGGDVVDSLGTDFADFYKITANSGENISIKATPLSDAELSLTIYDAQRKVVNEVSADNPGQILNLSQAVTKGGDMYLAVECYNGYCGSKLASYTFDVSTSAGGTVPAVGDGTGDGDVVPPSGDDTGDYPGIPPSGGFFDNEIGYPGVGGIPMALIWANVAIFGIALFGGLIFYIYFAVCLQKLAKRTGTTPAWLAWIPVGNAFLMLKIAQKPLWWFLLLFVPIINIIAGVIVWMKIAERVGKESWVAFLMFVPVVGIAMPAYLAFSGDSQKKTENLPEDKKPEFIGGSKEADKPTVGYKHPCKYCEEMISPDSAVCPFCSKENPLGPDRCPKCHDPIEKKWKSCAHCGLNLRIVCPFCGKVTFFGGYCEDCGKKLIVICPNCRFEQPPLEDKCIKCGQSLKGEDKENKSKAK